MNPGPVGEGPRGALHHPRRDATRRAAARAASVVEGTAGNTGIGLAMVANALGLRTVIVIPETQSQEKKDTLRAARRRPRRGAGGAVPQSQQLREGFRPPGRAARARPSPTARSGPTSSTTSPTAEAHIETTGPEIWEQTDGKVDGFICAVGTGGTLAGVAQALRERKPDVAIGLADPPGAALYSYYTTGELKAEGTSITEGIGQGRITANLEGCRVDHAFQIPDEESLPVCLRPARA